MTPAKKDSSTGRDDESRLVFTNLMGDGAIPAFADEVRGGLLAARKSLPPKYFYDELGSQLFEAICRLPEYYLTRAEAAIFAKHTAEICSALDGELTVMELGSGSASKTRRIVGALAARQGPLHYIAIDISESALRGSADKLLEEFPALRVSAYAADYEGGLAALSGTIPGRALVLFLGSNIGNFDARESANFLRAVRRVLRRGDALLLGADLRKDTRVLLDAYDDACGVTAAFNLNLLGRINRELGGEFDLRRFRHRVRFNEEESRIEMHLESLHRQSVRITSLGITAEFEAGETIHTENSFKYTIEGIAELATQSGFSLSMSWFDDEERFSSNLLLAV